MFKGQIDFTVLQRNTILTLQCCITRTIVDEEEQPYTSKNKNVEVYIRAFFVRSCLPRLSNKMTKELYLPCLFLKKINHVKNSCVNDHVTTFFGTLLHK